MDPNKGHGENIRTYNRTENRTAEFLDDRERPPPGDLILKTCDRTAFIFQLRPTNPRRSPTWRAYEPEGSRSRRTGIAMASQPLFNGEAKRQSTPREYLQGGRGS